MHPFHLVRAVALTVLVSFAAIVPVRAQPTAPVVLVVGDSISAAYGLSPGTGWVDLLSARLASEHYPHHVVNASITGDTTAGGRARLPALLMRHKPAVVVIELGGNDGLRGIPLGETKKNLQAIINRVKQKSPETKIVLAGMMIPPNMGPQYTRGFQAIYPDLARTNQISLIPFLLQGVGGDTRLNQADGIHPTAEGHKIVAENVWQVIRELL